MTSEILIQTRMEEDAILFRLRFSHCRRLLYFIATRVLGGPERAEEAVENCWLTASRNTPRFEYESAFRSWLLRVLIDEALVIRHEKRDALKAGICLRKSLFRARNKLQGNKMWLSNAAAEGEY